MWVFIYALVYKQVRDVLSVKFKRNLSFFLFFVFEKLFNTIEYKEENDYFSIVIYVTLYLQTSMFIWTIDDKLNKIKWMNE